MARILVVDDNPVNLDLMLYLLRAFGHDAEGTADGYAGLEAATSARYDIVLTDILMPGIDGYEFARQLRAVSGIPLVAVTALAMSADRARIASAGFDGYIAKPIEPRTFVAEVEAYLKRGVT